MAVTDLVDNKVNDEQLTSLLETLEKYIDQFSKEFKEAPFKFLIESLAELHDLEERRDSAFVLSTFIKSSFAAGAALGLTQESSIDKV